MATKKTKKTGLALSCWILAALILLIVFLVKKDDILSNLKSTNFFEKVIGKTPEFVEKHEEKPKETNGALSVEVKPAPGESEIETSEPLTQDSNIEIQKKDEVKAEPPKTEVPEKKDSTVTETPKPVENTKINLCFVSVNADGSVARKVVSRTVPKNDAPLTNAIKSLLQGPVASEKGVTTLIPNGTKLLGASVKNGIASLNFSEEFEFNAIGTEGYRVQLMQIVYTATEFSTVESVQFLIEGERKEYIGSGEDVWMWVGSPYSRSSFN